MKTSIVSICLLLSASSLFAKEYHVSPTGNDAANGDMATPFRTINRAAQLALPGDTVTVHQGTYREWINPLNGGESDADGFCIVRPKVRRWKSRARNW